MALPWSYLLGAIADPFTRAGAWRAFMPMLVREGITPTAALRIFRSEGGHIRTQTWHQKSREYYYPTRYESEIARSPASQYIPERYTAYVRDGMMKYRFEARIQIIGTDPYTGEEKVGYYTIGSDERRPKGWYENEAWEREEEISQSLEIEIESMNVIAYHEQK